MDVEYHMESLKDVISDNTFVYPLPIKKEVMRLGLIASLGSVCGLMHSNGSFARTWIRMTTTSRTYLSIQKGGMKNQLNNVVMNVHILGNACVIDHP